MLNLKLPFFGTRGTIKNVKEINNIYEVTRYGIAEKQIVPKKEKNLQGLYDNYYEDTKKYLESSYDKYNEYKRIINERKKEKKYKGKANAKAIRIAILIASIIIVASGLSLVNMLSNINTLVYLNMSLLALSITTLSATSNVYANYLKDHKKDKYISEYQKYQEEVNEYNINKSKISKNNPTIYNGIAKEETKENTFHKTKKKVKEEIKNAA